MRIAYVEDNATNQALVERVARMTQHVIVPYTEGEVALDALRNEPFDMIMMDIELAGNVNGLDVVRALREAGLQTPIIAVTAYAMKGDRDRCLEAGCNDYLPKPIPIKDLLDLLNRYAARLKAAVAMPEAPAPALASVAVAAPEPTPAPQTPPVTPPVEPVSPPAPAPVLVAPPVVAVATPAPATAPGPSPAASVPQVQPVAEPTPEPAPPAAAPPENDAAAVREGSPSAARTT